MNVLPFLTRSAHCLCGVLICALVTACAHAPPPAPDPRALLHDEWFVAPAASFDAESVFTLSEPMRRYVRTLLTEAGKPRDTRRALLDALLTKTRLRLDYDAVRTRTAEEAFEARAGNCLSLVIMTAAFAKYLDLPVTFQSVRVDEDYSRSGNLFLASGHVNLVLGAPRVMAAHGGAYFSSASSAEMTVDFLPPDELRGQRTRPLEQDTIIAMYMNNRAAETLADGRVADSYAWARRALLQDPRFAAAANTLAVIYMRSGHPDAAETALTRVLAQEPESTSALANMVTVLQRAGRVAEAAVVAARLRELQPYPPFHFFDLGRVAMAAGDYPQAIECFERELRRQPYQHEAHFWVAQAYWRIGDRRHADEHLRLAMENSTTLGMRDLYSAKLDHLRALRAQ